MENIITLSEIDFKAPIEEIVTHNAIPPKFKNCSFDNYIPNDDYPSQKAAVERLKNFVNEYEQFRKKQPKNALLKKFFKAKKPKNIYLDGVFGVGKTHLLAAVGNAYKGKSIFLSFSDLMYLVSHYTLMKVVQMLTERFDLILLDEFELDDPGDAMTGINFIREVNKTDSVVITTSNALPTELGARKLDILIFKERIGKLIDAFETIIIDGKDYRIKCKNIDLNKKAKSLKEMFEQYKTKERYKMFITFEDLLKQLRDIHPTKYANFSYKLDALFIENLRPFKDSELPDALRFTHLIDTLYYGDVEIFATSQTDLLSIFHPDLKDGKFKSKIGRCISRLSEKCFLIQSH